MRYQGERSEIQVIGKIWMPAGATCAMAYPLGEYELGNIGELTRENCASWLRTNSGDFQHIEDFRVDISHKGEDFVSEWVDEESELTFNDCMYPGGGVNENQDRWGVAGG